MTQDATLFHSVRIGSAGAIAPGGGSELPPSPVVHVLWLAAPTRVDTLALAAEISLAAHPPSGLGLSSGQAELLGAPSAAILLIQATTAQLQAASERARALFPGSAQMTFDQVPGFDLEGAVRATLEAIGLASSTPKAPEGSSAPTRI